MASIDTSPLLTGNFGEKPGPDIISVGGADPNVPVVTGFSDGDTITITFSENTNRPAVATRADIDRLFTFLPSIGDIYVGTWASPSVLVITILETGDRGLTALTIEQIGDLTNEAGTSLASTSTFDVTFTAAEFGQKQGPLITSIKAVDPVPILDAVFGEGDTITVRFSEATNRPFFTEADPILSKANLDDLFSFSENIGDDYTGVFVNPLTLVITIVDAVNLESPPQIGLLTLQVKDDLVQLRDEADTSLASTSLSPPLTGTFGNKAGPSITSLVALDPFGTPEIFGKDDTITVTFSEPTNGLALPIPVATKADIDTLFSYTQNKVKSESLGGDYRGEFIDPLTLVITFITTAGSIVSEAASIGDLRFEVQSEGNLKGVDENGIENTLVSVSSSPPLSGTFVTKPGPEILSIVAADPDGQTTGEDIVFSNGDTITVKFSEPTNKPPVATKTELIDLFAFSESLGAAFTGLFIDPETLIITIVDSTPNGSPAVDQFTMRIIADGDNDLKSGTGTSLASEFDSKPAGIFLTGSFGKKSGPAIQAIIADDPDKPDDVFGDGDTITIKFLEPTNTPDPTPVVTTDDTIIISSTDGTTTFTTTGGITTISTIEGVPPPDITTDDTIILTTTEGPQTVSTTGGTTTFSTTEDITTISIIDGTTTFGTIDGTTIFSTTDSTPIISTTNGITTVSTTSGTTTVSTTKDGTITVRNLLLKADLDTLFIFSQSIGDDYTGVFTLDSTLLITVIDTANLEVPPAVGELRITVKASGNLLDIAETSLPSTSVSPLLAGSFGNFVEVIPLTDGGSAFTTLPTGITASITLPGDQSGVITIEKTTASATVSDETDSDAGIVVDFLGNVMEITPSGGADCTVDPFCSIAFTFSRDDAIASGTTPPLVKIFHDADDSGDFTIDEILDGLDGRRDTSVAELLLDILFEASSIIDDNSKFAVGGVKALALGALAGAIGRGAGGEEGGLGETSFGGLPGDVDGGFGGIIAQFDLSDPTKHTKLHLGDRGILRQDLYENQGINNIIHVTLYFGLTGSTPEQLQTSKTYIMFEKGEPLKISDPNSNFGNKTKFDILERDAYNFVLKYDIEFTGPMPRTDMFLYVYDLDRNISKKYFVNVFAVGEKNPRVPVWVKNNAGWWADGQISDTEFIQAIQFLSKQGIINIPPGPAEETAVAQSIPYWVKNTAEWWSNDLIIEDNFVAAIQWLATNGIIVL